MQTKGIVLAGGSGTRLYPMTSIISKQLLPVYDKPMIYYPISTLMLSGIREILIISTPHDTPHFQKLLSDGSQWGIKIDYAIQKEPKGIAEAFIYGADFIGNSQVCLILGDNLIYGKLDFLRNGIRNNRGGTIFAYKVNNPQDYGVVTISEDGAILSIEEKPKNPSSNYAIPGIYIFDSSVVEKAKKLKPSPRGELEITDIQKLYLAEKKLDVIIMGRGIAWLDTGTPESLIEAGIFIHAIEKRQGRKIACLEEIAFERGFITKDTLMKNYFSLPHCEYKNYLMRLIKEIENG